MSNYEILDGSLLNSIIGEGTGFKGEFNLSGLLRIDGDFTGKIYSKGKVLIGLNGRAECDIYAETVVVGGIIHGNIFSTKKIVLLSTCMMIGNVSAPCLIIEEGVIFSGNCKINNHVGDSSFNIKREETKEGIIDNVKEVSDVRENTNVREVPLTKGIPQAKEVKEVCKALE